MQITVETIRALHLKTECARSSLARSLSLSPHRCWYYKHAHRLSEETGMSRNGTRAIFLVIAVVIVLSMVLGLLPVTFR
jgi:hypothetical protein